MTTTRFEPPVIVGPGTGDVPLPTWPPVTASPGTVNQSLRQVRLHGAVAAGNVIPLVYGRQRVEGRIFYWQPEFPTGRPLHVGVIICHGEVEEITNVRINGSIVQSGLNGITFATYKGTAAGDSDANVVAYYGPGATIVYPKWPGIAWARFSLDLFNVPWESIESFSFDVKGMKVKDPRTGVTAYSANAALCAYHFLTSFRGCRIPESSMDAADAASSWWKAADKCDETVDSEKRYELNLVVSDPQEADGILEGLRTHFQADIFSMKGKVRCVVEGARASALDFSETGAAMNLRSVKVSTIPASDRPGVVTVTFPNAAKDYADDTAKFPQTTITGQAAEAHYTLPGCTSEKQAMRIVKILQRKAAFEKYAFEGIAGPEAVRLTRRDVVRVTTRDGLSLQKVDVLDLEPLDTGEYQLRGREHDSAAYSDEAHVVDTIVLYQNANPWTAPEPVPFITAQEGWNYGPDLPVKLWWGAPRVYPSPTLYGASHWSEIGTSFTLFDAAKINDGTFYPGSSDALRGVGVVKFDAGAGLTAGFTRLDAFVSLGDGIPTAEAILVHHSDDGSAWTAVDIEYRVLLQGNVAPHYSWIRREWENAGQHRYWKITIQPNDLETFWYITELQFYEPRFDANTTVVRYDVLTNGGATLALSIPAAARPTEALPFDATPYVVYTGDSSYNITSLDITVRPFTRVQGTDMDFVAAKATTEALTTPSVQRQTGATPGVAQSGSDALSGERRAGTFSAPYHDITEGGNRWRISAPSLTADRGIKLLDALPAASGIPLLTGTVGKADYELAFGAGDLLVVSDCLQTKQSTYNAPFVKTRVACTAGTTVNGSVVDITGATVTFTPPCDVRAAVTAFWDVTVDSTSGGVFVGELYVAGSAQAPQAILTAAAGHRTMVGQTWVLDLTGTTSYTIKLTGRIVGTASCTVAADHTGFSLAAVGRL